LVKDGVTGLIYVKKVASSKMQSLTGHAQDKMAIFGHIVAKWGKCGKIAI